MKLTLQLKMNTRLNINTQYIITPQQKVLNLVHKSHFVKSISIKLKS